MLTCVDPQSSWIRSFLLRLLAVGMLFGLSACIPKNMMVDEGLNPKYEDEEVRFRTTYYFRVFDYCADKTDTDIQVPFAIDSLYRFRMTGKANALTNKIHFESGTLKAEEIDPFGAAIAYDKTNDRFYFKSQNEVKQEAKRQELFVELDRIVSRYEEVAGAVKSTVKCENEVCSRDAKMNVCPDGATLGDNMKCSPGDTEPTCAAEDMVCPEEPLQQTLRSQFQKLITSQVDAIIAMQPDGATAQSSESELKIGSAKKVDGTDDHTHDVVKGENQGASNKSGKQAATLSTNCMRLRRGFQILGPEGFRNFDQDERLIMAMTSSGKPLISAMRELAGRVLDNQTNEAELALPLLQEDLRITKANQKLDTFDTDEPDSDLDNVLQSVIGQFQGAAQ